MFNFKTAEVRKEKFNREVAGIPKGQKFTFKYRPILSNKGKRAAAEAGEDFEGVLSHQFELSKDKFNELDLNNHAIAWLLDKDDDGMIVGVALIVTEEDDESANTLKGRQTGEKMCSFTHENIQRDLAEAGVIDVPVSKEDELVGKNQLLELKYVADIVSTVPSEGEGYEFVKEGEGLSVYQVVRAEVATDSVEGDDELAEGELVEEEN